MVLYWKRQNLCQPRKNLGKKRKTCLLMENE